MNKRPINYKEQIDIRFSDLDFYGHVNSKHYVDIVSTARLVYLAEKMKFPIEQVAAKGIGFYLTKSTINYKRPIVGLQRVSASSYVSEVKDGRILIIPFSISSSDKDLNYADGILEFAVIDMKSKRSIVMPEWLESLFFTDGSSDESCE